MNNDFHDSRTIYELFQGLEMDFKELTTPFQPGADEKALVVNGDQAVPIVNGTSSVVAAN